MRLKICKRISYLDGQGYDEIISTQTLRVAPLTGTLDGPKKVSLKNKGLTSIALMGSTGIDGITADKIVVSESVFGETPDDKIQVSPKEKSRTYHYSIEDINNDVINDIIA